MIILIFFFSHWLINTVDCECLFSTLLRFSVPLLEDCMAYSVSCPGEYIWETQLILEESPYTMSQSPYCYFSFSSQENFKADTSRNITSLAMTVKFMLYETFLFSLFAEFMRYQMCLGT